MPQFHSHHDPYAHQFAVISAASAPKIGPKNPKNGVDTLLLGASSDG
jgi:hypothetical protein